MSKPTVLLIDDERAYANVIKEALKPEGIEVLVAGNAMEAMCFLPQAEPNLILLDVMMPDVDGLTLLRWLREHSGEGHIPVYIVSAKTMPEDQEAAIRAGADGFLGKPFSMQDLKQLLSKHLPVTFPTPS